MHKYRKIIGVIAAKCDGEYQKKLISGIEKKAFELDYDVLVFSPFSNEGSSDEWHRGENSIYSIINYDLLDGVILVPDSIKSTEALSSIVSALKNLFSKPTVTVEYSICDFPNIDSDDGTPIRNIINHLVREHKITDIAFVSGPENHPHSKRRLEGYFEALIENDLTIDRSKVYYGNFWYTCGEDIVNEIYGEGKTPPQAIACANDIMAISICEALKKRGISVPEDIVVTGYDSVSPGHNYSPCITSAVLPAEQTGENAVLYLNSKLKGTPYKPTNGSGEICVGQSCGCGVSLWKPSRSGSFRWSDQDYFVDFMSSQNFMQEQLNSETELGSFLGKVSHYTFQFGEFSKFCLCLCENWDGKGSDHAVPKYGYTPQMNLVIERGDNLDKQDIARKFSISEMLPVIFEKRSYPTSWFFTPVHFYERCFGYAVISYGREIHSYNDVYRVWMRNVNTAMESLRRQQQLAHLSRRMLERSSYDDMTGLYNRIGYNIYADEIFRTAKAGGKKILAIVGKIESLREINAVYGSTVGDEAVKATAKAFRQVCGSDKICFRTDGSEFLLLDTGDYSAEQVSKLCEDITSAANIFSRLSACPIDFKLKLYSYSGIVRNFESIEQAVANTIKSDL